MEVVREVIQDELHLDIPIAGLAKDGKHRTSELLFGFPPETIGMPIQSFMFKFFTQIQDEVHRFAITFHKDKRSKSQTKSELDTIKGIGEKKAADALCSRRMIAVMLNVLKICCTHRYCIIGTVIIAARLAELFCPGK